MNKYAVNQTPHNTVRFYVDHRAMQMQYFLRTVCIWGNFDHEINGCLGFEVSQEIAKETTHILGYRFNAKQDQSIIE